MPGGRPRIEVDPALLRSGLPAAVIARRVGRSPRTVLARMREAGIPTRPRGSPPGPRGPHRNPRKPRYGLLYWSETAIYAIWSAIVQRSTNPRDKGWKNYGGRAIGLDPDWREFSAFHRYVSGLPNYPYDDAGVRVLFGISIDRIDNDGDYEPGNIRWTTRAVQNANWRGGPGRPR